MNADKNITVVGISGSLRQGSYTRMAVQLALQAAHAAGAQTRLIDLREYKLLFCGEDEAAIKTDVARWRQEMQSAQGIIFGTPEYHGSFSGVLKNAIDLLEGSDLRNKVIGLVGVSGGALGGVDALTGLRAVARSVHAWVIPQQAAIPEAWQAFDAAGKLKDHNLANRVKEIGQQVTRYAALHASENLSEATHA